jgi:3-methyladenine DNA glycosylase AlkC
LFLSPIEKFEIVEASIFNVTVMGVSKSVLKKITSAKKPKSECIVLTYFSFYNTKEEEKKIIKCSSPKVFKKDDKKKFLDRFGMLFNNLVAD